MSNQWLERKIGSALEAITYRPGATRGAHGPKFYSFGAILLRCQKASLGGLSGRDTKQMLDKISASYHVRRMKKELIAFVPTRNAPTARAFYEKTLGLSFISEDPFALVFESNGVTVRIANVSSVKGFKPAPYTILGWQVSSVRKAVQDLSRKGVKFERFDGMEQDDLGIWNSPSGAHVAWFKDPDGNILSITEA